ncbi:transposase, partial [Listeria sp. ILCC797]|uniref:transposase n=1 Tax=Listeria sp. ILCC797 TaxID=1918333 RepID=UPI0015CFBC2D
QFEQSHTHFFQELLALVMTAQRTMRQLLQEVEFNAQTGTYTYPKGYTQSMDALKQRLNTVRGVDPKLVEALKAYQVLAVVYYDAEGKPQVMWLLEQNGVGVNDPKLKKYLDKAGKYLDPSDYQIITNEELNKKITESWKTGTYYMDGTQYTGMAGGTLRASAYVESVKGTLDESGLMDVVMGLGLSTAAIRGSMTYEKASGANIPKLSSLSEAEKFRMANQYKQTAPVGIPDSAKINAKTMNAGYEQLTYKWNDGQFKYEVRWHTRTPGAPVEQGNTWVVQRTVPGNGGNKPQTFFKVGDNEWVEGYRWYDAINARKAGNATPEQIKILDKGHWKE